MTLRSRKLFRQTTGLEQLVADHVASIEPGLRLVDTRPLLGQAIIDLVGIDARGILVFVALALVDEDDMVLRVLEAASWCADSGHVVRRLYPEARLLAGRAPRVLFVAERFSDALLRKVRHLSFPEVDCLEVHGLEIDGVPAAYFELAQTSRATPVPGGAEPEVVATPIMSGVARISVPAPEPARARPSVIDMVRVPVEAEMTTAAPEPAVEPAPSLVRETLLPEPAVRVAAPERPVAEPEPPPSVVIFETAGSPADVAPASNGVAANGVTEVLARTIEAAPAWSAPAPGRRATEPAEIDPAQNQQRWQELLGSLGLHLPENAGLSGPWRAFLLRESARQRAADGPRFA